MKVNTKYCPKEVTPETPYSKTGGGGRHAREGNWAVKGVDRQPSMKARDGQANVKTKKTYLDDFGGEETTALRSTVMGKKEKREDIVTGERSSGVRWGRKWREEGRRTTMQKIDSGGITSRIYQRRGSVKTRGHPLN